MTIQVHWQVPSEVAVDFGLSCIICDLSLLYFGRWSGLAIINLSIPAHILEVVLLGMKFRWKEYFLMEMPAPIVVRDDKFKVLQPSGFTLMVSAFLLFCLILIRRIVDVVPAFRTS